MNAQDRTALMHAVLDGEATPEQGRALMALLAEDAQARAEYDALHALVAELGQLPPRPVPAGFAGRVMTAIEAHQLSTRSRVIDSRSTRGWSSWIAETLRQALLPEPTWSGTSMKKIWIGGAVAALAVVGVAHFGFGGKFPPDKDTMGTVVPAERHRAAQPSAGDVGVTTPTGGTATTTQPVAPATALTQGAQTEAARTQATQTEAARTEAARTEARTQAARTEAARTEARTQAARTEAARTEARTQAARTEAARTEARTQAARTEAARTEARTQAARTQGSTNK